MKTIKSIQLLLQRSTFHTASVFASCACYYWVLSIFPALMFGLTVLSLFSTPASVFTQALSGIIPQAFIEVLENLVHTALHIPTVPLFSTSAILWLWSASKGLSSIREGMNAVLRIDRPKSFIRRRVTAIAHFCLFTVGFAIIIFITIFGEDLLQSIRPWLPILPDVLLAIIEHKLLYAFLLLTLTFAWIYRLHPNSNISFFNCCLGGAVTAAGWLVLSYGFTIYVDHFASRFHIWGDLGTLLLAAIWLRYCALLILFGIKYAYLRSSGHGSVIRYVIGLLQNIHE